MPAFEIPVALIINDTVVVKADTADDAQAVVQEASTGTLIDLHRFMKEQGFEAGASDVDVLQVTGPAEETIG